MLVRATYKAGLIATVLFHVIAYQSLAIHYGLSFTFERTARPIKNTGDLLHYRRLYSVAITASGLFELSGSEPFGVSLFRHHKGKNKIEINKLMRKNSLVNTRARTYSIEGAKGRLKWFKGGF